MRKSYFKGNVMKLSKCFRVFSLTAALPISASLLMMSVGKALAGGGFTASCKNIQVSVYIGHGGFSPLEADCYNVNGQLSHTYVDLNAAITNNDGNLAWQKNGGFAASVDNCGIDVSNVTRLHCLATKRDGSKVNASITLDDEIANYNSNLTVIDGF